MDVSGGKPMPGTRVLPLVDVFLRPWRPMEFRDGGSRGQHRESTSEEWFELELRPAIDEFVECSFGLLACKSEPRQRAERLVIEVAPSALALDVWLAKDVT